jgi:serine/threonine protein kinase
MAEKEIFLAAVQKSPRSEQCAYARQACGADQALCSRVLALLEAHNAALDLGRPSQQSGMPRTKSDDAAATGRMPEIPTEAYVPSTPLSWGSDRPGARIGPYVLQTLIGEGGMGSVYLALQEEPVRRQVALKIIKAGLTDRKAISRFEAERQALALMDHPNIAKVLDGGTTADHRPYFVMELVKGTPITTFCNEHRLTIDQRLALMVRVCRAVQHAHQKGIIHRDLKPSNVLITVVDRRPVPKVIDFGVAKAIDRRLNESTELTQFGQIIGTLAYMSPEQAGGTEGDVDTRADIYALGVLLYELLTGDTPLPHQQWQEASLLKAVMLVKEATATRLSLRIKSARNVDRIAVDRRTSPTRLYRSLEGDIDAIVLKCLERDRGQRYDSAVALARDIERYLADEPVEACPPSMLYQFKKAARRHRRVIALASLFLALLVGGSLVSLEQARRARGAEKSALEARDAEAAARQSADLLRRQAQRAEANAENEARKALASEAQSRAVLDFLLSGILRAARPKGQDGGLGQDVTVRQAMEAIEPKISGAFSAQPAAEAAIRNALGETYLYLGESARALAQLQKAVALRRQHLGAAHPDTLVSMSRLGWAYRQSGLYKDAILRYEEVLKASSASGPNDAETIRTMEGLAHVYLDAGRVADGLAMCEKATALVKQSNADDPDTLALRNRLAQAYLDAGRVVEARELFKATLDKSKHGLGPDHPQTLETMNGLALAYHAGGNPDSIPLFEKVLASRQTHLGADHPQTWETMDHLALAYLAAGRLNDALPLFQETLRRRREKLGSDHPATLESMSNIAYAYRSAGRTEDSISIGKQVLALQKQKLGPDHPSTILTMDDLANTLASAGHVTEAFSLYDDALERARRHLPPHHVTALQTMVDLAAAYQANDQNERAIPLLQAAVKDLRVKLPPPHPNTLAAMSYLADAYFATGQFDDARILYSELYGQRKALYSADDPEVANVERRLGAALSAQHKNNEAEPILRKAMVTYDNKMPASWQYYSTVSGLGACLSDQAKYAEAEQLLLESQEGLDDLEDELPKAARPEIARCMERLVALYDAWNKPEKAALWRRHLAERHSTAAK